MGAILIGYFVIVVVLVAMGGPEGWAFAIPVIGVVAIGAIVACVQDTEPAKKALAQDDSEAQERHTKAWDEFNTCRRTEEVNSAAEIFSSSEAITTTPAPIAKKRINNNEPVTSFVAIDFETATGRRDSACAMAIVGVCDSEIVTARSFLIQPPDNDYNSRNCYLHGISPVDTEFEPTIDEYYDEIFAALDGAHVVAHNASFDLSVLNASLEYYGLEPPVPSSVSCTYKMTGKKLNVCCDEYGIDLNHHDPLSDARACALLYISLQDEGVDSCGAVKKRKSTVNPQRKLQRTSISDDQVSNKDTVFYGKNVVITGVFKDFDRVELANTVQNLGASVKSSITQKTDILICGADCGPAKLAKVQELKDIGLKEIKIIKEKDLKKII